jgi:hypothetical protein
MPKFWVELEGLSQDLGFWDSWAARQAGAAAFPAG